MAEKRLQNLEKRLLKAPEVVQEYERIISQYIEKGYVKKVTTSEECEDIIIKWYLPHFPVVRKDRSTIKV